MFQRRTTRLQRGGFSLPELLVAFALIIFIMAVIAQTFGAAGRVVSDLKVADEMESKLRSVMIMLRDDLKSNHFDREQPGSQLKLSDPQFWDRHLGDPGNLVDPIPTPQGFFRIFQVGQHQPIVVGGEVPSSIMAGSSLHFTVYRQPDTPGKMFRTQLPVGHPLLTAGTQAEREARFQSLNPANQEFRSPWGEVTWWLTPSGTTTIDPNSPNTEQLYVLRRHQRAIWPNPNTPVNGLFSDSSEVSAARITPPEVARLNDPVRVAAPAFRYNMPGMTAAQANGTDPATTNDARMAGRSATTPPYPSNVIEDIVIGDVLSFDVTIKIAGANDFLHLHDDAVQAYRMGNPSFPVVPPGVPGGVYCFDTWTNQQVGIFDYRTWFNPGTHSSIPLYSNGTQRIRIRAIQVTLRIWNQKDTTEGKGTGTARQMTIVQEL